MEQAPVTSGVGQSGSIFLQEDYEYLLTFTSAGTFTVDLQVLAGDDATWLDVYEGSDKVTLTDSGKRNVVVVSGTYRMNVTAASSPVTMHFRRV